MFAVGILVGIVVTLVAQAFFPAFRFWGKSQIVGKENQDKV